MKKRFLLVISSALLASCTNGPTSSSSLTSVTESESVFSSASSIVSSSEDAPVVSSQEPAESQEHSSEEAPALSSEDASSEEASPSEETISSQQQEEQSSEEEPVLKSDDTSEEDVAHTFTLDKNNGQITGGYTNSTVTAKKDDGSDFQIGYNQCMGSTNQAYDYAQMKKSSGAIFSLDPLPLRAIAVTFSSPKPLLFEALETANAKEGTIVSDDPASGQTYLIPEDHPYFRISAGTNAAYIKSITITYGSGELPTISESTTEHTQASHGSTTLGPAPEGSVDIDEYYQSISGTTTGATLKTSLHNLIKDHTNRGYNFAYQAYPYTDADEDGYIIDTYSACKFKADYDYQGGPCGMNNYSKEGDCFNREHTIPQSIFSEGQPMKSDLHHLLPTDGYVNNRRGNYPHAEVGEATFTSSNGTEVGSSSTPGYEGTACEPIDEYKGDFARIYFYMVTRYEDALPNWGSYACFTKNTFPSLSDWAIDLYLKWNAQDPVSEKEINRNNAIYGYQYNRNPFVDHPEYAVRIWGSNS